MPDEVKKAGESMRKIYLPLLFMILLLGSVFAFCTNPKIFSEGDVRFKICGVNLGMDQKTVAKILGKPDKINKHYEGAVGDVLEYRYDFGMVRFEQCDADNYDVAKIYVDKINEVGPRNIKVGDAILSVLAKFPDDRNAPLESWGEENNIRYLYGKPGEDYGVIEYDKTKKPISIRYYYQYFVLAIKIVNGRVKSLALIAHND